MNFRYSFIFIILIIFGGFIFSASPVQAAIFNSPIFGGVPPSSTPCPDTSNACKGSGDRCWNSEAVGVTDCGQACSGGNAWSQYEYSGCYLTGSSPTGDDFCSGWYQLINPVCSTGDKCVNPGSDTSLKAGFCDCTVGATYKYCCSATGNPEACIAAGSQDPRDPPEGECPGGYIVDGNRVRSTACVPMPPPPTATTAPPPVCTDQCTLGARWCAASNVQGVCVMGPLGCTVPSLNACPASQTCNSGTCVAPPSANNILNVTSNILGTLIIGTQPGTTGGTNYSISKSSAIDTVLTAPPFSGGQTFLGWSGCFSGGNQCFATVDWGGSWTVTANYSGGPPPPGPTATTAPPPPPPTLPPSTSGQLSANATCLAGSPALHIFYPPSNAFTISIIKIFNSGGTQIMGKEWLSLTEDIAVPSGTYRIHADRWSRSTGTLQFSDDVFVFVPATCAVPPTPTSPPAPTPNVIPNDIIVSFACQVDRRVSATVTYQHFPVPPATQNTVRIQWDDGSPAGREIIYDPWPASTVIVPNLPARQSLFFFGVYAPNPMTILMATKTLTTPDCSSPPPGPLKAVGKCSASTSALEITYTPDDPPDYFSNVEITQGATRIAYFDSWLRSTQTTTLPPGVYDVNAFVKNRLGIVTTPVSRVSNVTVPNCAPPPPPPEICGDGIDNDRDGAIDEGCGVNGRYTTVSACVENGDIIATVSFPWEMIPPATQNYMQIRTGSQSGPIEQTINPWPAQVVKVADVFSSGTTYYFVGVKCNLSGCIIDDPAARISMTSLPQCVDTGPGNRVTVHVRQVPTPATPCTATAGVAVPNVGVNISRSTPPFTASGNTGAAGSPVILSSVPSSPPASPPDYTLNVAAGLTPVSYKIDSAAAVATNKNRLTLTVNADKTIAYCFVPKDDPWYQTSLGDVRFNAIDNSISAGDFGSIGENAVDPSSSIYPGIFFSSETNGSFGAGEVSSKRWKVDSEYDYNQNPSDRNGTMSYSFFKSKASQEGVDPTDIVSPLDTSAVTSFVGEGKIFEINGDLAINNPLTVPVGKRIVILVKGNLNINENIKAPAGSLLIFAVTGDINIDGSVGTGTLDSRATQLEGYYSAEGDINIEKDPASDCAASTPVPDKRLNVGGALIANAKKPFSRPAGGGEVKLLRNLCPNGNANPALFVASRLDFVTQLTDFHKITYTKWEEARP